MTEIRGCGRIAAAKSRDVATLGRLRDAPGPNARVEAFLPHGPVLKRAACVVCHGGHGITVGALGAGVPVCAVPFCRDQFDVVRRVEMSDAACGRITGG
jgi:UDP:flavonoid glycosyltransferase YjiC (YdhE family)